MSKNQRLLFISLAVFLIFQSPVFAKRIGLVFGSNYRGNRAGIPVLELCENDAKLMETSLKNTGRFDYVKVLLGPMVTAANMKSELEKVAAMAKKTDTVTIYFAGHGTVQKDAAAPNGLRNFLVMFDRPHVSDKNLDVWLKGIKTKDTVWIFDACFSGGIVQKGRRGMGNVPVSSQGGRVIQNGNDNFYFEDKTLISSADSNETAVELEDLNHGLFTYWFARGMDPANGDLNSDHMVSVLEAFEWSSKRITREAMKLNRKQHPQIVGSPSGILIAGNIRPRSAEEITDENETKETEVKSPAKEEVKVAVKEEAKPAVKEIVKEEVRKPADKAESEKVKQTSEVAVNEENKTAEAAKTQPESKQPEQLVLITKDEAVTTKSIVDSDVKPEVVAVPVIDRPSRPADPVTRDEPPAIQTPVSGKVKLITTILQSRQGGRTTLDAMEVMRARKQGNAIRKIRVLASGKEISADIDWVDEEGLKTLSGEYIPLGFYSYNQKRYKNRVAVIRMDVPAGIHEITIQADDYPEIRERIGVEKNTENSRFIVASLAGYGSIQGKVFRENFETPVSGHKVWLPTVKGVNQIHTMKTTSDGSFWFLNLPPSDDYQLKASIMESLKLDNERLNVKSGDVVRVDVVLGKKFK